MNQKNVNFRLKIIDKILNICRDCFYISKASWREIIFDIPPQVCQTLGLSVGTYDMGGYKLIYNGDVNGMNLDKSSTEIHKYYSNLYSSNNYRIQI